METKDWMIAGVVVIIGVAGGILLAGLLGSWMAPKDETKK